MSDPLVCEAIGHSYDGTPVLDTVDLAVAPGEFVTVLGSSGCGKTTLLRGVAGLVTPERGRISLGGVVVSEGGRERVPTERRRVGLVFQEYALFPSLTVAQNVGFAAPEPARVAALLALVGLPELGARKPAQLSGGQQQRVALARALAPKPTLLLLDEPFANVDADRRERLGAALKATTRQEGASVLLVTHDRQDALSLSDRVVTLVPTPSGAVVAQSGPPDALYHRPVSAYVASLTGACWMLDGEASGATARTAHGEVSLVREARGPVTLVVRPEQARFVGEGTREVIDRRFSEGRWRLTLTGGARCMGDAPVGARGGLAFDGPLWAVSPASPA